MKKEYEFSELVTHLQTQGYIYPGSQIYGGLANSWDYGPLGVLLKQNIKRLWWQKFVQESPTNVGIDSAIIMNPRIWEATGHVSTFNDPLTDCKKCKTRFRVDELLKNTNPELDVDSMTEEMLAEYLEKNPPKCPVCGSKDYTKVRQFNMMFKTQIGATSEKGEGVVYLRPETAQGMFVNFKNVLRSTRRKLPVGICNIGKSFRNEITPGNFIFRMREFEQMEMEFFCKPGEDLEWFYYWKSYCEQFLLSIGLPRENLRFRDHTPEELSFYSVATTDIEYRYPFGWGELWGIADRTDYDLKKHQSFSGESMEYLDPSDNTKYVPYCVEPALGLDRLFLALVSEAYDVQELDNDDTRIIMRLHPALAPYKVAILPLVKKLTGKSEEVYNLLAKHFSVTQDETASIGKRYRRQDMIGTPFCVTIDFETLEDEMVTIRERDSMSQIRLPISELVAYIQEKIFY